MTLAACAEIVRQGDPDRFRAAMAAPPAARARLFPLYAFNLEVARAPWVTQEPLIAEMRLQWWRDALAEIAAGAAPRAHEVCAPLAEVIGTAALDTEVLEGMIDARRWDVHERAFDAPATLWRHLDTTAGGLMWSAARALGAPEAAEATVREMGMADGLARWFLAVPDLSARGKAPMPGDTAQDAQELAREGLARVERARAARHAVPRGAAPALVAAWRAESILRRAATDPGRIAAGTLAEPEVRRRWGVLWRGISGRW